MSKHQFLLDLYSRGLSSGQKDGVRWSSYNFDFTLTSEQLGSLAELKSTGYTNLKAKQLYKWYWNPVRTEEAIAFFKDGGKSFIFELSHQPKIVAGEVKKLCMKDISIILDSGILNAHVNYRATYGYGAMLADLWLFHTELTKIAEAVGAKLGDTTYSADKFVLSPPVIFHLFNVDPQFAIEAIKQTKDQPYLFRGIRRRGNYALDPTYELKFSKDIQARTAIMRHDPEVLKELAEVLG